MDTEGLASFLDGNNILNIIKNNRKIDEKVGGEKRMDRGKKDEREGTRG